MCFVEATPYPRTVPVLELLIRVAHQISILASSIGRSADVTPASQVVVAVGPVTRVT
jgi:hypothetical protein